MDTCEFEYVCAVYVNVCVRERNSQTQCKNVFLFILMYSFASFDKMLVDLL